MTTVIAEINEKIPNAYKHPLVLNDDRLIYLFNPTTQQFTNVLYEKVLEMDSYGCLNWVNENTRISIVRFMEDSVRMERRKNNITPVEIQRNTTYQQGEHEAEIKKNKRKVTLLLSGINLLLAIILGLSIWWITLPAQKFDTPKDVKFLTEKVSDNINKEIAPISSQNDLFVIQKNTSTYSTELDEGVLHQELALFSSDKTTPPIFIGSGNFTTGIAYRQNMPTPLYSNNGEDLRAFVYTDNRVNKDIFRPYLFTLSNNKEKLLLDIDGSDQTFYSNYSVNEIAGGDNAIFMAMSKNENTSGQRMELYFFNQDKVEELKEDAIQTWSIPADSTFAIKNVMTYNNTLILKRVDTKNNMNILYGNFAIIDGFVKFENGGLKNLSEIVKDFDASKEDIIDFNNNIVLLKNNQTGQLSAYDVNKPGQVVNYLNITVNKNATPILHTDYNGKTYVVATNENGEILLHDVNNITGTPLLVKRITNSKQYNVYKLMSLRNRIYWLEGTKSSVDDNLYTLYKGVAVQK